MEYILNIKDKTYAWRQIPSMMFEKFTERGRKVIVYAREEAERLQNDYLGTEHLLLGTLREEDGIPVAVLRKMGIDIEQLRMEGGADTGTTFYTCTTTSEHK